MTTKKEKLAREIASALDDMDSLQMHLGFVQKYSERYLRKILQKVLSMPESKIHKSRGALFTFLVQQGEYKYRPNRSDKDEDDPWD